MNPFSEKLKKLRGDKTVEEMANAAGVAASSIYKMESTARVRWQTVERAYGASFRDERDHLDTLLLWALEQTRKKVALYQAVEAAEALLRDEARAESECATEFYKVTASMTPPEAWRLLQFAKNYAASAATRKMTAAWMEAVGER